MSEFLGAALAGFTGGMAGAAKGRLDTEAADAAKSKHMIDENHLAEQRAIMIAEMQDYFNDGNSKVENDRKVTAAEIDREHDMELERLRGDNNFKSANVRGANDKQLTALAIEEKKLSLANAQDIRLARNKVSELKQRIASGINVPVEIMNAAIGRLNSLTGGDVETVVESIDPLTDEVASKRTKKGVPLMGKGDSIIHNSETYRRTN